MFWKQPAELAIVRQDDLGISVKEIVSGEYSEDLATLWEFAALSSNVYEKSDEFISTSWEKLDDTYSEIPKAKSFQKDSSGLKIDVLINKSDEIVQAAIIYRGTTCLKDFYSNLDWLTRYNPFIRNSYAQVREQVKMTVKKLKEDYGDDIKIISAGHSLGGGLAQQAAYAVDSIKLVYAFDPSPVTGFFKVPKRDRDVNKQAIKILRIYEHGEILAYLRVLMKASYALKGMPNENPKIIEIRFNFENKGNIVNQHSMYALASNLKTQ